MYNIYKATKNDIDLLVKYRMKLLSESNRITNEKEILQIGNAFKKMLTNNFIYQLSVIAIEDDVIVGVGSVCYYQVFPTCHNPSGKKAYITNMYVEPKFRNRGIGSAILNFLVKECIASGTTYISLESTNKGRNMYLQNGFTPLKTEMQYMNCAFDEEMNK